MKEGRNDKIHIFKYIIGLVIVILLRLLPHPPNVEPITATLMPFAKSWGWFGGLIFGILAVLSFDVITGTLGVWSLLTVTGYALLGIFAGIYFKKVKGNSRMNYVIFAIIGTIFYDAITGLTVGPLFFGQTFMSALIGQIPFTAYHLAGNIVLAVVVSPLVERWLVENPKLETTSLVSLVKPN